MELEQAFEKYHKELAGFIFGMCKKKELSEDIVQETFVRAIVNQNLLKELHEKQVRAWLYKVSKNIYVDMIRSGKLEKTTTDALEFSATMEDYDAVEWEELFERLPGKQGVMMYMRYVEGYTSEDIASLFNMPSGTVRYELSMARKSLKQAMKNYWTR